jgi:hypothetical protein
MTSALERAAFLLREDMLGYIDAVEQVTHESNTDSDEEILVAAREHLPRLVAALRGAIGKHQADPTGLCVSCAPLTRWPCPVVNEMHSHMVKPGVVWGTDD